MGLLQCPQKSLGPIQTRQSVDHFTFAVKHIVNTVAGKGAFQFAAVAEIDRHLRNRPLGLPVQHEAIAQHRADFLVGVQRGAKESAVGATEFVGQVAHQPQRENRLAGRFGFRFGRIEVGVPIQFRGVAIALAGDTVQSRRKALPLRFGTVGRSLGHVFFNFRAVRIIERFKSGATLVPQCFDGAVRDFGILRYRLIDKLLAIGIVGSAGRKR